MTITFELPGVCMLLKENTVALRYITQYNCIAGASAIIFISYFHYRLTHFSAFVSSLFISNLVFLLLPPSTNRNCFVVQLNFTLEWVETGLFSMQPFYKVILQ